MVHSTSKPARQALIVLGMHRSGTSALGGVLARLGAEPPRSLMREDRNNERGYWESWVITAFHDRLLQSAGTHWSDWGSFNRAWLESPVAERFLDELDGLITTEFDSAPLFFVKDPRLCRFLPIWRVVLERRGIEPKIIIPVRNPEEVARSLATRDQIPWSRAMLIWLRHILDAEASSRDLPRVFVRYGDLLTDWRTQVGIMSRKLGVAWPRWSASVEYEIESYLAADLNHHMVSEPGPTRQTPIGDWSWRAYQAVDVLVQEGESDRAISELDDIKQEFDRTAAIYAPVLQEDRGALETRITESEEKLREQEDLRKENLANYNLAMTHKAALDDLREQYQNRENSHAALEAKYEILQAEMLQREQDHRARLSEVTVRLNEEIRGLKAGKRQAEESLHERFTEIAGISKRLIDLESRNKEQSTALKAAQKAQAAAAERKRELEQQLARSKAQARALRLEIQEHVQLNENLRQALGAVHASKSWRSIRFIRRLFGMSTVSTYVTTQNARSDEELLRDSPLFDASWYLKRYRDVQRNGMDPVEHYLQHGALEKRDPGPAFSTAGYLTRYPDVLAAGTNPLIHYLRHGRWEGRCFVEDDRAVGNGLG